MKLKVLCTWSALALLAVTAACANKSTTAPSSPDTPTSASGTVGKTTVTLTSPVAVSPGDGQQFRFADQPLKLVVNSAVSTGTSALTYMVEIATDAGFSALAYSKGGIAATDGAQQTLAIDKLPGQKTYFWRARGVAGTFQGPASKPRSFTVGPEVILQTPTIASPAQNGTANGTASLVVNNVGRSGPVTGVSYKFDLSDTSSFAKIIFTTIVPEQQGNQTSASVSATLTNNATYFWRVQALDQGSGATSNVSSVASFRYVAFDMHQATILNSPSDLANWAQTANITLVQISNEGIDVEFDRKDGPDRWPDSPFGDGSLEYTLGACFNLDHWYCSAPVQFWAGRDWQASGPPQNMALNWFYDPARWGPMAGHQPSPGETVGFFACAGDCRNKPSGDGSIVHERTNVVLIAWPDDGGVATYTSSSLSRIRR